jgi:hypothetical protein
MWVWELDGHLGCLSSSSVFFSFFDWAIMIGPTQKKNPSHFESHPI